MLLTKQSRLLLVTLFIVVFSNSGVYAQFETVQTDSDVAWVNFGVGASSIGISGGISVSNDIGKSLVSIRGLTMEEVNILGPSPQETAWELGVLYGRFAHASYGVASIAGGIGFVGGVHRSRHVVSSGWLVTKYEPLVFRTIGLPVEGQLFWTPLSFLGIGLYGFANLNPERSFVGALLCFQFGDFR